MKDTLYVVLIILGYTTSLIVFLFSFKEISLTSALIYNLIAGVFIFILLSFIEWFNNNKK